MRPEFFVLRPNPARALAMLLVCLVALPLLSAKHATWLTIQSNRNSFIDVDQRVPGESLELSLQGPAPVGAYQWFHNDLPIAGATGTSFHIASMSVTDGGNYRLRLVAGSDVVFSNSKTINLLPSPPSVVDPGFRFSAPVGGYLNLLAAGPNGSVIVSRQSGSSRTEFLRISRDGTVDPSFAPPLNLGILGTFSDGRLLVSEPPFRLNADGSPSAPLTFPVKVDRIYRAAIGRDGSFVVLAAGFQDTLTLYRFLPDGTPDGAFAYSTPTGLDAAAIPGASTTFVDQLEVDPSGRIYVIYSVWGPPVRNSISANRMIGIRLTATGAEDRTFVRQDSGQFTNRTDGTIYLLRDGRILRQGFGAFWTMLRDDGSIDPSWSSTLSWGGVVDRTRNRVFITDSDPDDEYKLTGYEITHNGLVPFLSSTETGSSYQVVLGTDGSLFRATGSTASGVAVIRVVTDRPQVVAPRVRIFPATESGQYYSRGHQSVRIAAQNYGTGPFTYLWLALDGQSMPANLTTLDLLIPQFGLANTARYQLRVTGPQGTSVLSNVIDFSIFTQPYLANLSGRAMVGSGEDAAIVGFVLEDRLEPLIRGAGPALKQFGVSRVLPDPFIAVHDQAGVLVRVNDNWEDTYSGANNAYFGAFAFSAGSRDSQGLWSFTPGAYSVGVADTHGDSGVGLLEIYCPSDAWLSSPLANLSLRARTSAGEATAIAGFVIVDPQEFDRPLKVLLRAVGPTLTSKGVAHALSDPVLTVYDAKGTVIATNNDWAQNNTTAAPTVISAAMQEVGAFELPTESKDSALLLTLQPGVYSMHADGGTGIVLLEVYVAK